MSENNDYLDFLKNGDLIERRKKKHLQEVEKEKEEKLLGLFERNKKKEMLESFYENQQRLIKLYEQDAELLSNSNTDEIRKQAKKEKREQLNWDQQIASTLFSINIMIFLGNLAASILSGSYSIMSIFLDSMMDLMSSIVVHYTIWSIKNTDPRMYPRGKHRLELISTICCSIFMAVANIMMILQTVQAIATGDVGPNTDFITLLIVITSIFVKAGVMIVCWRHRTTNSETMALDQRNDIMTRIVALSCAYIGNQYWPYTDPIGAILICTFVASTWFKNAASQIPLIVGHQADQEEISRVLMIALSDDPRIKYIDHVMMYHIGEKALVELHIVMDGELPLKITHDISENLQDKINSLDFVERAFVHVDYFIDGSVDGK